jgi:hypothetical protein
MDEADLVQRPVLWDPNLAMEAALTAIPENLKQRSAKAFCSSVLIWPELPQMSPSSKPYRQGGGSGFGPNGFSPTAV